MEENCIIYLQVKEYKRWKGKEWDGGRQIVKDMPSGCRTLWYLYGNKVLKKTSVHNLQSHRRKNQARLIHKWSHKHEPGVCVQANGTLHLLLKMFSVAQTGSRLMG